MWNMQSNIFLKWSKQFSSRLTRVHLLFILERGFRSWYLSSLVNIIAVHFMLLNWDWRRITQLSFLEESKIILSRLYLLWNLLLPFYEGHHFLYHCSLEALDPKNDSLKWHCKWKDPKCLNDIFNIYFLNKLGKICKLMTRLSI